MIDLKKINSPKDPRLNFPRPKMGLILLQSGLITREQLDMAIEQQTKSKPERIGHWLCKLGYVNERDITVAISKQYGVPWVDLSHPVITREIQGVIPAPFILSSKILPLDYIGHKRELSIAFAGPVDFILINVLRKMLNCIVFPYIGDESLVRKLIGEFYGTPHEELETDETGIPAVIQDHEIETLAKYLLMEATTFRTNSMMIEPYHNQLWARFLLKDKHEDLFINLSQGVHTHSEIVR